MRLARVFVAAAAIWGAVILPSSVLARDFTTGSLKISAPWSRPTPPRGKVGVGYMVVQNNGSEPDRLVSAESPAAGRVEVHMTSIKDGVASMRPVSGGVAVAPGKEVTFAPDGLHVMFVDLKAPLKQGDKVPVTLRFEKAGKVDVEFDIQPGGPAAGHGAGHKM